MFVLKREKDGATHYATGFAAAGPVTGWAVLESAAAPLDAATAEKVKAYYANRKNTGDFVFLDKTPAVPVAVAAEVPPPVEVEKKHAPKHHHK